MKEKSGNSNFLKVYIGNISNEVQTLRIGLFICEANELPLQTGNSVGAVLGIFGKGSRKDRIFISP